VQRSDYPQLAFSLPLEPARLSRARQRIREYLFEHRVDALAADDVVLAIEEAMTNAVRHSGSTEDLDISLRCTGGDVTVTVRDHGRGFDVERFDPKLCPDLLEPGGRGLFLIASLMDDLTLSCHSGLELRAVKAGAFPDDADHPARERVDDVHAARPHVEPRAQALLDEIDDGFVAIDWEWRYIYANPVAIGLLRYPMEELMGSSVWQLFPELVGSVVERNYRLAMEQGIPSHFEHLFERHGAWYEKRVYPTSSGISVYFNDITKRKRAESVTALQGEALRAINEILRAALATETEEELGAVCLTVAARLTGSALGFIGRVGDDGLLHDVAISDPGWAEGAMHDETGHGRPPGGLAFKPHGLYGEVLLTGEPLVTNSPGQHLRSVGLPPGHPPIASFLGVPLTSHGETVGIIALANRDSGFGDEQRESLETIAPTVAAAFERKRAEETLRRNAAMLDQVSDAVIAVDGEMRVTYMNAQAERQYGLAPAEAIGQRPSEFCAYEWPSPAAEREAVDQLERTGRWRGENIHVTRDGRRLVVESTVTSVCDPLGKPAGVLAVIRDVTERKAAEERERREHRETTFDNRVLRAFAEYESDDIFDQALATVLEKMASRHGVFGYIARPGHLMCPSLSKMLDTCEIEGKCIHYPPEKWKGLWAQALTEKRSLYTNIAPPVPPGHPVIHNNLATPILFHGEVIGLLNIANKDGGYTDADSELLDRLAARVAPVLYAWIQRQLRNDERKAAEEALLAGEERYRELLAHAPPGIYEVDFRRERFTSVNDVVCMMTGYSREELLTMDPLDLLVGDGRERFRARIASWLGGEPPEPDVEYRVRMKDGREIDVLLDVTFSRDEDGVPLGATVVARDITERKATEAELRQSREDLDRAQAVGQLGSWRLDVREDVLTWSDETYRIFGLPVGTPLTYETFLSLVHPDDRAFVEGEWQAALRGAPYDIEHRLLVGGQVKWVREKAFLEHAEAGELLGGFGIAQDVTARKRVEEELARRVWLSEELNRLNTTLATPAPSDRLLEVLLEELSLVLAAESASIGLLHDEGLEIVSALGMPGVEGRVFTPEDTPVVWLADEAGEPQAIEDCEHDSRVVSEVQRRLGIRSVLVVPLASGGERMGQMYFNWHTRQRRFAADELDFVRKAGANASAMLRTSHLLEAQRHIATTLQKNLMHRLPAVDGLELAEQLMMANEAELIGGDFCDAFLLPDGQVAVVIGDVAGKGIRAAGLTETVRSTMRAFAAIDATPAFILRKTNELLLHHDLADSHVTAFLAVIDPRSGHLSAASAGHPPPVHLSPFSCQLLDVTFGLPLNAFEAADYLPSHLTLTPDDCLVLYTDGVIEARHDGELFGEARLVELVGGMRGRSAAAVAEAVTGAIRAFGDKLRDDVQVLVVRLA
jgi:PAS domain S-box-containing protein